jgi:hypothetical protein
MAPSATAVEMEVSLQRVLVILTVALAAAVQADAQTFSRTSTSSPRPPAMIAAPNFHASPPKAAPVPLARDFTVRDFVRQNQDENANRDGLGKLGSSLFQTTKTPFMTESRMPLAHAFGSRVQFNFDMTSTINRSLIAGPLVPPQMTEQAFVQGHSEDRYGISLSVPLGRGPDSGASQGLLTGLARALHRK